MAPIVLSRRNFVGSSAGAGAALAFGFPAVTPPADRAAGRDVDGTIHAWLRVTDGGNVTLLLAGSDPSHERYRELGPAIELAGVEPAGSWERLRAATSVARSMIHETVARAWRVDPAACALHPHAVVHPPSARCLGYTIWVDPV